ncbi:MAG: AAA family ATPase [Candidatus Hodarchaeales archaeon]
MRILIGITGLMGSGKSSVASYLEKKHNFKRMRISGKMRSIAHDLGLEVTRDFLQGIGKFMREFDDDVWVKHLSKEIKDASPSANVVVDDIRRQNEVDYLRPLGFTFIRVESPDNLRRKRIETRGKNKITDEDWSRWSDHLTEIQVPHLQIDFTLKNDGSTNDLEQKIDYFINNLQEV